MFSDGIREHILLKLEDVVEVLMNFGLIDGIDVYPLEKPTHGPCCQCQICGRDHDVCVCEHNAILLSLVDLKHYVEKGALKKNESI